jgi:hypothetical protein
MTPLKQTCHTLIVAATFAAIATSCPGQDNFFDSFLFENPDKTAPKAQWQQSIAVSAPPYCSEVQGDVTVNFTAPGMTEVKARCWQQPTQANPDPWGHDADLAPDLKLDAQGNGSFVFHADQFPNGPINIRLFAKDGSNKQDYCELQLFNKGGVVWNQGPPKDAPSVAKDMKMSFSDDFNGELSIAKDGTKTYWTHWGGGDGSVWPFTDFESPNNPFSQVQGQTKKYLRIHATKPPGTNGFTGTLTPIYPHNQGPEIQGITVKAPCYMECRFLAQNATGTWPAFWVTTQSKDKQVGCDELDLIEAYGTNAKSGGLWTPYHVTTHFWGQPEPAWVKSGEKGPDGNPYQAHRMVPMTELGGKNSWSTTFHTYGLLVTPEYTAYYLDNIEVLRHPSGKLSATLPMAFLVNLAIGGGGWKPNLERYGNQSDMWVDYIRLYQGETK